MPETEDAMELPFLVNGKYFIKNIDKREDRSYPLVLIASENGSAIKNKMNYSKLDANCNDVRMSDPGEALSRKYAKLFLNIDGTVYEIKDVQTFNYQRDEGEIGYLGFDMVIVPAAIHMLLHEISARCFLSYGPDSQPIELRSLNVIIGPNGSGKSNLIEAIALLQAAPPGMLVNPIREGGGVRDWLWKGTEKNLIASVEAVIAPIGFTAKSALRYRFDFTESNNRFEIVDERIEYAEALPGHGEPYFFYRYEKNHPVLNTKGEKGDGKPQKRYLKREEIDPEKSILAQRRDPDLYPEITYLADVFSQIRVYRNWAFGRGTPPRQPQPADLPNKWLLEDCRNLGLVLSRIRKSNGAFAKLKEFFSAIYDNADDFDINVEGGTVQIFVRENNAYIPATRLSDGTLRYLCLLAILCDPTPPPLICIEEPELGMHPDIIGKIAELLRYAAERTQVIVTTHSVALVDAFTSEPESILVCEKHNGSTTMTRLDAEKLKPWLEKYRLGALWTSGEIGGNRW